MTERKRIENFPTDYQPYVKDPNRVYKKREGVTLSGKKYKFDDLTGERFGRLVVEEFDHIHRTKTKPVYYWRCRCDCGGTKITTSDELKNGWTQSCGCFQAEQHAKRMAKVNLTHGLSRDPLFKEWMGINRRVLNPKDPEYPVYSKYGICDEWKRVEPVGEPIRDLTPFYNFRDWALANGYEKGLTIDRYADPTGKGPYAPWNCRWVDMVVQNNNRSVNIWIWDGDEWLTAPKIADKYGIEEEQVRQKLMPNNRVPWTIHEFMTWAKDKERSQLGKRNGANNDKTLCKLSDRGRSYDTIVLVRKVTPPPDGGSYIRRGYKPDGQA